MSLWGTAWKNIRFRKTISVLTIFSVAVAVALAVFITLTQEGVEKGAAKGYGPYELVIGAEGSGTQLALNTFYHLGAPVGNISYEIYEQIQQSEWVDKAYPVTKGDNYQGFQIVGTETGYLSTRYPDASLLEGTLYQKPGEVLIGSHVAKTLGLRVGDEFYGGHGAVWSKTEEHDNLTYKVVGILPPLFTPDDKAIFTTVDTAWLIHGGEGHEAEQQGTQGNEEHAGEGDITAIVVKPKGLAELQMLKSQMNQQEKVQAVYSSKTIADVINMLDVGGKLVKLMAFASVLLASIAVLLSLSASAAERKKDIGLLRLLGKSKMYIMSGMLIEGSILTSIGMIVGIVTGHVGSWMVSGKIFDYAGIQIQPWTFFYSEVYIMLGALILGVVASIWPALRAYKVQPLELFHS
ncbi:ABC transporter permease [Brevibacillus sp. SYSU BS000544]|uniref:ABC transporter permease n=1 Tax=Brevibacillus sp. SYSU BS000544 TaxID=3416443 RepID=UPI003CE499E1